MSRACNICGKEFDVFDEQNEFSICRHVQYGSVFDGEWLDLNLCCECFDDVMTAYIMPRCKTPPILGEEE